ncbi:hypothetical protein ANCCEY_11544 [Ancylostoma ceylanicum]|uniref:Uncharacterized protein n=1 Tax=Ancylostoma ceylanicum TaxID=53326 RepID=A0A0D6LDV4_9BILA|nr:hypothetical protein ANCCEY_11544 [Ancylostoma ceylanicum]
MWCTTLGDVPAIGVESSRVDITRQLPHLPSPFNPAVMAAQLGMFSNPQLLNMMQFVKIFNAALKEQHSGPSKEPLCEMFCKKKQNW